MKGRKDWDMMVAMRSVTLALCLVVQGTANAFVLTQHHAGSYNSWAGNTPVYASGRTTPTASSSRRGCSRNPWSTTLSMHANTGLPRRFSQEDKGRSEGIRPAMGASRHVLGNFLHRASLVRVRASAGDDRMDAELAAADGGDKVEYESIDADMAEVTLPESAPTPVDEEEEEEDDGPDPAKDLAELVMEEVFEWNSAHEVVDAEVDWIDLEAVVEQTQKELLELKESMREFEEKEQAAAAAQVAASAPAMGAVIDAEVVGQSESRRTLPPEGTNIFEDTWKSEEEDEEEDLEEPDGRTVALGRNNKFLYGFDRSQISKEVLDAVEAAGNETRLAAYSRLLAGLSSEPYQDNLRLARQFKWTARVLLPREEDDPSSGVSDAVLTGANVVGVKELVNMSDGYARSARISTGGWCLWVMKFLRNRDEDAEGHLALDDETVGMMYDLRSQVEMDNTRMKVGGRMFRKGLEEEVFMTETGGVLVNRTAEQFGEYAMTMGQRVLRLAGETMPGHARAFDILREMTREVLDEMASLAYDKVRIDMGFEVSKHTKKLAGCCPMSAAEVLKAIATVAFYLAEPLHYLKTGEAGLNVEVLQGVTADILLFNSNYLENRKLYEVFARDGVIAELNDPAPAGTMKMSWRLLRRVMAMYKDDAVASNRLVLAEALAQRLYDADESMPDVKTSWNNLMWNLEFDDDDEESEELMNAARRAVTAALVEKLIQSGLDKPKAKTTEMCALLGMGDEAVVRAFSIVSGDIFEKALLGYVREQGTAADGSPTTLFRSDPLTDEELQELKDKAKKVGVSQETALDVVSKELQVSLRNLVTQAGKSMRSNFASDGTKIIADATHLVDGLGQQLVTAFGGDDVMARMSIAGQLASLDEYWASELCFKMVDAVRDPEGAKAEAGIPGALTAAAEPQWEVDATRVLELLGLRGQR